MSYYFSRKRIRHAFFFPSRTDVFVYWKALYFKCINFARDGDTAVFVGFIIIIIVTITFFKFFQRSVIVLFCKTDVCDYIAVTGTTVRWAHRKKKKKLKNRISYPSYINTRTREYPLCLLSARNKFVQ